MKIPVRLDGDFLCHIARLDHDAWLSCSKKSRKKRAGSLNNLISLPNYKHAYEVVLMDANSPTLSFVLHDVARLLKKRFEQNAKGSGLTRSQWQVLAYLAQNEGINQSRLAELLDVQPITLGRVVDKLETLGFIERTPHPSDRRIWLLHLTPAARPKLAQLRILGDITRGEALAEIPDAERECLLRILQKMKTNLTGACDLAPVESK
jgi:DNA-binding MarR family transcriptional regulator